MNLSTDCTLTRLEADTDLSNFSCLHVDLDDFLHNDSKKYSTELLGVTYLFTHNESNEIVAFFTVSNASLNLKVLSKAKKKKVDNQIPHPKRRTSYPSVLLGRLGVSNIYHGCGVGQQILNFIKGWFRYDNKTGCRFIIVDAYNEDSVLNFYKKNEFIFLQPIEDELEQLKEERGEDVFLKTRHMIFDLSRLED